MTSDKTKGYLHGFSAQEQNRLYEQARFLEQSVYAEVDFTRSQNLIEIGCGVGAQTEILLRRFPHLKIQGIDASPAQLDRARERLAEPLARGRVALNLADASKLPLTHATFDSAFICWFLEHVSTPIEILRELHRVMKPGGKLYCSEVQNQTLYFSPACPATMEYWNHYNEQQISVLGDPFVGAKLGDYLLSAGFREIKTRPHLYLLDARDPTFRSAMLDYWTKLLMSGAPGMLASGRISQALVDAMKTEMSRLKANPRAVYHYSWIRAEAIA